MQFQFFDDSANTTTQTFLIDQTGNTSIAGTLDTGGKLTISNSAFNNHLRLVRSGQGDLYLTPSNNQLLLGGGGFSPASNNAFDLGRTDKYWETLWLGSTLKMGGTTVLDSSKNLSSIGTISSGAITSSGLTFTNGGDRYITGPLNSSLIINAKPNDSTEGLKLQINGVDKLSLLQSGNATFAGDVTATGNYTSGNDASIFTFQRVGGAVSGNIEYNDATTDMEFGTTTAHTFSLKTANTRRLTIDNAGTATFTGTAQATRVGIGVAPHATAGLNITSTAQHVRFNNGSELGIISLESDGALRIWSHGDSSNNEIEFYQGSGSGAASMTIDGSGNVLVGKTNNALANDGVILRAGGELMATNTNDLSGNFNRLGNDGGIISFYKDGAAVGSIGVAASDNIYFAGSSGSTKGIYINNAAVYPANTGGDVINNAVDLGQTGTRWKNIYSSGVVYISDGILNSGAAGSATVFNEDGTTADFRVESDGNEHMLVVNGGTNRVGIGEVAPDRTLHVKSGTTNVVAKFESTDQIAAIEFTDSGGSAEIGCDGSDVVLFPAGTEKFRVQNSTGYLVAQSASQVRLVLGSTGNSSNNTSNWIRGTGSDLGLNSAGGTIGMEIGGNLKLQVSTAGQILANPLGVTVPTFSFIGDSNTGMTRPTGDTLQFVCGGSAKWRINSSGHLVPENQHTVDIGGTNAEVRNVYAQGISFASNANASGMTSELLDDYEEGTWVPGFGGATLSSYTATYTKIGNQVTVHYRILTTGSMPTSSAQVQISGLPFTINSTGAAPVYARFYTPNDSSLTTLTVDGDSCLLYTSPSPRD